MSNISLYKLKTIIEIFLQCRRIRIKIIYKILFAAKIKSFLVFSRIYMIHSDINATRVNNVDTLCID